MKLIIQIPCLNEEETLPETLAGLPRQIDGVDEIEWLIIDDGSTDRTVQVAKEHGVHHVVRHYNNKGLARAFQTGLDACLKQGADIIVNTDGDNQYPGSYISDLVAPIIAYQANMVIGSRPIQQTAHFSRVKKNLQWVGSAIVRYVSRTNVPDAPSGFRAFSRETALRLNILTDYTYTLETIIQAGNKNLTIASVPIQTNPKTRESRLMKSMWQYVLRSGVSILWLLLLYRPLQTFSYLALPFGLFGSMLWGRYFLLLLLQQADRASNIHSFIVGAVLLIISFLIFLIGLLGHLVAINRKLSEETLYRMKQLNIEKSDSQVNS